MKRPENKIRNQFAHLEEMEQSQQLYESQLKLNRIRQSMKNRLAQIDEEHIID